jgi:predicted ribonuclease YlaK
MTVVLDTNVLLDYLMVIQKFVADIERMEWPSVVVIPSVVISELDWCVDPCASNNCQQTE